MCHKILPGFIGGKTRWVPKLEHFRGKYMVEPFAGSAAISFELAGGAHWNEIDPVLVEILRHFDEQVVPDVFTLADYYTYRQSPDWYRHAFCLQKMAFAGIFRHTRGKGFNVPPDKRISEVRLRPAYEEALARWRELLPVVTCGDWLKVPLSMYRGAVVVLDPPFKGSHTPYNHVQDYREYWQAVDRIAEVAETVIAFEYADVLERFYPGKHVVSRLSRPNGKLQARPEGMIILGEGEEVEPAADRVASD